MQSIQYPLAVGSGTTRIIEAGAGPAVLFSHGLGARADRWRTTVERIADHGYRAVAWDLPGHGFASRDADGPSDVPGMAQHALGIMDTLGIADCVAVGTSLGAHIVAYAACRAPSRFRALGLVGALGVVPIEQEVAERISRNVQAASRELFPGKLGFVLHDPALVTEGLIEEEWRTNTAPGTTEGFGRVGHYLTTGIARDYVAAELRSLFPPDRLLLVWGAEDKAVPLAVAYACQKALGDPELAIVPAANHCPYFENPAVFDAALLPLLRRAFAQAG
jgi:2-hydroxy-6-oxonona-2,4-dienedioate hydrolase